MSAGDHAGALANYRRIPRSILERLPPIASNTGYCSRAKWPDMLRCALRATELLPQDDYAWQQVAIANSKLDRDEEAVAAGRVAIRLNPKNAMASAGLALVLHKLGDPAWEGLIVRALELMPSLGENAELAALRNQVSFIPGA
jgi:tetratricopeptide (TPR) repeat protein